MENKQVTLGSLSDGQEFFHSTVKFKRVSVSTDDNELIHCQISGQTGYVYIANHTLVSTAPSAKDLVREAREWLDTNNVIVYNRIFEYKGYTFSIEDAGSKFQAVNSQTGEKHKAWPTKTVAVYWACKNTI